MWCYQIFSCTNFIQVQKLYSVFWMTFLSDLYRSAWALYLLCCTQVMLDGCTKLTEWSLYYIRQHCVEITHISMIATSVSYQPLLPPTISLRLQGCPVVHQCQDSPGWLTYMQKNAWKLLLIAYKGVENAHTSLLGWGWFSCGITCLLR